MSGKLYIVGTPIGNLGDLSPRAIETLGAVDFIAAEDTRVSLGLLSHFDIRKPLVSYHEHNLRDRGAVIVGRILAGESCAVITDAGMPCVSDPGEDLVARCAEAGIETVVIPGPSAVVSAVALSGLASGRFSFEGFLSTQKNNRKKHLAEIKDDARTLVFYEAPHKLAATLADLHEALGNRRISLCRELTKLHEEVIRTTLAEAAALYQDKPPRGEFVLVIEGAAPKEEAPPTPQEAAALVKALQADGLSLSAAAKEAARVTGLKRGEIYRIAVRDS